MTTDNPAQRLYDICNQAKDMPANQTVRSVWSEVLDIDSEELPEIYRALGTLNDLANETQERVEKIPGLNHEIYLDCLPSIRSALSPVHLNQTWNYYSRYLDTGAMKGLQFCANELARHHHEEKISAETLDTFLARIEELVSEVMASDLHPDLKALLVDLLEMIRKAILEYRLRGAAGIKDALVYAFGTAVVNRDLFEAEKDKPIFKKFWTFITDVNSVAKLVTTVKALQEGASEIMKMLPSP